MSKTKLILIILIPTTLIICCVTSTIIFLANKETITDFWGENLSTSTQELIIEDSEEEINNEDSENKEQIIEKAYYEDEYFKIQLEDGWEGEKQYTGDIIISKGDFWLLIKPQVIVTGGGFGYPYNGICIYESSNPIELTTNLIRTDNSISTTKEPNSLPYCNIYGFDPDIKNVWLGSRIGIKGDSVSALISKDSYFDNYPPKHPAGFIEIMYGHKSLSSMVFLGGNGETFPFVDINDQETQEAIAEIDEMIKTLIIKEYLNE